MKKLTLALIGNYGWAAGLMACPICNPDAGEAVRFLFLFMGSGAIGMLCALCWAYAQGHFNDVERPKYRMLQIDSQTGVKI